MHSYVDHRGNKAFLKQLFSIFLIFTLYFNSINQAHAVGFNGWTLSNPIAQGASTVYNGLKNVIINGKNFAKTSTAIVTPVAKDVSKVLVRGVAGVALSVAVEQLLGGVDWILDSPNNRIIYHDDPSSSGQYNFKLDRGGNTFTGVSASAVCQQLANWLKTIPDYSKAVYKGVKYLSTDSKKNVSYDCLIDYNNNGTTSQTGPAIGIFNPDYANDEKYLPLDAVSQKVISNAEAGNSDAKVATTAAAADIVNEAEKDDAKARPIVNQLEANAKTQTDADANTATGETKPNTETGGTDLALEFPTFCGWAPQVCEAAQTVISFPQTLTNWWETGKSKAESWALSISEAYTATKEWLQDDKDNNDSDNDPPEITPIDIGQLDTGTFKATAGCPQPIQVPVNIGSNGNVEISYEPICQFASKWSFVAPLIGFLSGAMIIVGVGRKGEDSEI